MPWYKFQARHGGGRQSLTVEYRYYSTTLKHSEYHEEWELWVDSRRLASWDQPAVGRPGVKRVHKLPRDVHQQLVKREETRIAGAKAMLDVLARTEVTKR